jgi:hypothetical protein
MKKIFKYVLILSLILTGVIFYKDYQKNIKKSPTSTDFELYSNEEYRLSFEYPSNLFLEETKYGKDSLSINLYTSKPIAQDEVILDDFSGIINRKFSISIEKSYDKNSIDTYLEKKSENEPLEINGTSWSIFRFDEGFDFGPSSVGPFLVLRKVQEDATKNNEILYTITIDSLDMSNDQKEIIKSMKFNNNSSY